MQGRERLVAEQQSILLTRPLAERTPRSGRRSFSRPIPALDPDGPGRRSPGDRGRSSLRPRTWSSRQEFQDDLPHPPVDRAVLHRHVGDTSAEEDIVTVITAPEAYNEDELYVDLRPIFGHPLFLKCEGFNFAGSIKLKAAAEMVAAAEEDGHPHAGLGHRRVVVREPGRRVGHDRGQQGLPVPLRDRPALQPVHPAVDGGPREPGAHHLRAGRRRRLPRGADRLRPQALRLRRPVRVAQPVHEPGELAGAQPDDGARDRPRLPRASTCCSSERGPRGP